jgi:hypothetical protein
MVFVGPVGFKSFHLRGVNIWSILDFGGATRVYSGFITDPEGKSALEAAEY